jgi:hypothetical protein
MSWTEIVLAPWIVILVIKLVQVWWHVRKLEKAIASFQEELRNIKGEVDVFIDTTRQKEELRTLRSSQPMEGDKDG